MSIEVVKKFEPLFGSWYVKEQLGKGSFGEVYLIEREDALGIRSQSALKYMHISSDMSSSSTLNMDNTTNGGTYYDEIAQDIVKEIKIMSSLKGCSNIVSYEDHDCIPLENGQGWDIIIRMELLTSLNDYVKNHQMTERDTIRLGIDICNALALCEANNIVHRDIKPGNIMVSENGCFKLGDFGIARTVERGTMGGFSRKGTAPYMAPEIYRREQYSDSVDIYSLGIVMYQLLNNGRIPFMPPYPDPIRPADEENAMYRRLNGERILPPANGCPELQRIVLKACAFQVQDRYPSASQMKADLEKLLTPKYTDTHELSLDPPPPRKKTWILVAAIGAVVVILAAALIILLGKRDVETTPLQPTPTPMPPPATTQPENTVDTPTVELPEETSAELEWTDWDDMLPEGITGKEYAIECRQVYRSTECLSVSGNDTDGVPEEGYQFLESEYGGWGEWSGPQLVPINSSDTTEVVISTEPKWNYITGSTNDISQIPAGASYTTVLAGVNHIGSAIYRYEWTRAVQEGTTTYYNYRTREKTNRFINEAGWSPYSDSLILQEDGIIVSMKMQYRYAKNDNTLLNNPSMDNFAISNKNYSRHYSDVSDDAWYSPNNNDILQTVDELGILLPDMYLRFRPDEQMTIGQLIRAAVIVNRIYNGYTGLLCQNDGQYQTYAEYAEQAGMIVKGDFPDLSRLATRQEMAYVLYHALPEECMEAINDIDSISDMDMSRKYYDYALAMARAGIITVTEGNTFNPENSATRAQAAAMIEKLVHIDSRTKIR